MIRRKFLKITLPLTLTGGLQAKSVRKPELSFGVIADPQYADQPAGGSRFYRESVGKLKESVNQLNKQSLDFVVTLGDVIDKDFKSFDTMMPLYEKLDAPHRLVLGNHDFAVADDDKSKVMHAMGMKQPYYSEVREGWRLIYLDGTDVSIFRHPENDAQTVAAMKLYKELKQKKVRQAVPWNGALGDAQMRWLKKELEASKLAGQQVIVFNHYPVCPTGDGHNLWNAEEVVNLLSAYPNVAAYMNGHNHKGNYAHHKGCHYVNFKGMVETENTSAYAVVRCFADRIEIDGIGAEPDRKLP
jgi:manganese-dependent ADP-ribose/CDP-alcohol diphosphatase